MGIMLPIGETLDTTCRTCNQRIIVRNEGATEDVCFCPYCGATDIYDAPASSAANIDREIRQIETAITLWRSGGKSWLGDRVEPRSKRAVSELRRAAGELAQETTGELYGHPVDGVQR